MSIESLNKASNKYVSFVEYAEQTWLNELVSRQNDELGLDQPIFLTPSFQKLCAESLLRELGKKPYFQKFGGNILSIVMVPTSEYNMFTVGLMVHPRTEQ